MDDRGILDTAQRAADLAALVVLPSAVFDAWAAGLDAAARDMPDASARMERLAERDA